MNRFFALFLFWVAGVSSFAQDAAQLAAQREAAEFERRMTSRMEELWNANQVQQRRINELREELTNLRRDLIASDNRFKTAQADAVGRADLQKAYSKMAEIEKARGADKELVLEQMKKLHELASQPPQTIIITQAPPRVEPRPAQVPTPTPRVETPAPTHTQTHTPEPEPPAAFTGEYYPYTIKAKDTLLGIIQAYNAQLKSEGKVPITLESVKKANPKLNPNNLMVGREIKIPVPPDK